MASGRNIYVHLLKVNEWRATHRGLTMPGEVTAMCSHDNNVLLSLNDGSIEMYDAGKVIILWL